MAQKTLKSFGKVLKALRILKMTQKTKISLKSLPNKIRVYYLFE